MRIHDIITEATKEKDYAAMHTAASALSKLLADKNVWYSPTLEQLKQVQALVKITGRRTIIYNRDYRSLGSSGSILDSIVHQYRRRQEDAGQPASTFTKSSPTARDMASQIAMHTDGIRDTRPGLTWTAGRFGAKYRDPVDHVVYTSKAALDAAWVWLESKGQKIYYYDFYKHLNTGIKIGGFVVERSESVKGPFSDKPEHSYAVSVRWARTIKQSFVRTPVDLTDQQAAYLRDIASTKSENTMERIKAILANFNDMAQLKKIIDASKKITPQDKAKLDAIIATAERFEEPK